MAEEKKTKGNCFIVMPITTPESQYENYKGDTEHFIHVLKSLFVPAVRKAGFSPIEPLSKGSDIIQADIIQNLAEAEMVLCDMSILNANAFYELGIRTALNKPVALVMDDRLKRIPFDTAILNCKQYKGDLNGWEMESQINLVAKHISDAYEKAQGKNSMWKHFGIAAVGEYKPGSDDINDKMDLLTREIMALRDDRNTTTYNDVSSPPEEPYSNITMVREYLTNVKRGDFIALRELADNLSSETDFKAMMDFERILKKKLYAVNPTFPYTPTITKQLISHFQEAAESERLFRKNKLLEDNN